MSQNNLKYRARQLAASVVTRDLLLTEPDEPITIIMINKPFWLAPEISIKEAMLGSCVASSIDDVLILITLKRPGTYTATASTIFLTTATDILSMGLLLGLTTMLVL